MDHWATTTAAGAPAGPLPLADWLAALGNSPRPLLLLGGTGHLELTADEEAQARRELEHEVLPQLTDLVPGTEVVLLTGLAPGADLLLGEITAAWCGSHGLPWRHVALLPVPIEVLWGDWVTRVGAHQPERIAVARARFEAALRDCGEAVPLWPRHEVLDWSSLELRQRQYRRLGAVLAAHCDVLVAILRPDRRPQPGGTAEIVAWRAHPEDIPAELAAGPRRHRSGWRAGDRLVVINPAGRPDGLQRAREALRDGNYLLSYDLVVKSARRGRADDEHEYVMLQALANAGSTESALRRFAELPETLRERDEDWLALAGRLHKDLGLRGGAGAQAHFRRAAAYYRTAFERTQGHFSAINAATTLLLAGDADGARALAHEVVARLAALPPAEAERERYFRGATEAEAALLLGDTLRARAALARIDALMPDDINARSRTRRQLRRVCRALALDPAPVAALSLPPVVFLGTATPADVPARALAYVGVTEPAELVAAEHAVAAGARVHAVLAAPREKMHAHWQWAHGTGWARRLEPFLDQVRETSVALGFLEAEDAWCDAYVRAMALGLSRLAARRLECEWRAAGFDATATADLLAHVPAAPVAVGGVTFTRRFAAVIFADFAGFSRLPDRQLPVFWAQFMRAISHRLTRFGDELLLKRTWGDALHLVCTSARVAAEAACEIQSCLEDLRPALSDALAVLELRLAAHYAPVFAGHDPIEDAGTYFGTQLSFTARIEPVTPPGMIFVTEAFAAQLALEAPDAFLLEYAGEVQLAKAYAQSRLFGLRAADRT